MNMQVSKKTDGHKILAIIVPCYNEQDVLAQTKDVLVGILCELERAGKISSASYVAFVNDGSVDKTWQMISEFHGQNPEKVRGVKLSRNFGHQNALIAGMFTLDFDICVTIDADLQDSPRAIIDMIEKYEQGFGIVYGVRTKRDVDSFFKSSTAHLFYALMKSMGVSIVSDHADFRLLSRSVVDELKKFRECNVFLRGIVPYMGFNSAMVYYERSKRQAGTTKYPLHKMLSFAWNGITSFSIMPLRIITSVGFVIFVLSIISSLYFVIAKCMGKTIVGWTSVILSLYIATGLIIFFIGVIGEYIGKIYTEVKQRPRFVIEEMI